MKLKTISIITAAIGVLAILFYALHGEPSPEKYAAEIEKYRMEKDVFMKSDPESPFKNSALPYKGLLYFPADMRYKVKATLIPKEDKNVVSLQTSDNKASEFLEFGYASFTLKGNAVRLLILEITDPGPTKGTLFLAFADSTSARETYGAGRYLELKKIAGMSSFTLDFNKCYNPYCAYNDNFSCPIPLKENIMKIAIAAGEKSYH